MIRALICDWGGVLMRTVDHRPRMAWEHRLGLLPASLPEFVFGGQVWTEAQHGRRSMAGVWADVAHRLGLSAEQADALPRDFWAGDQLDRDTIALIAELRRHGVRTALLSNFSAELGDLLTGLGVRDAFDEVVLSAQEGITKPDPLIYRRTLERLGVRPEEAIFVDDMRANVEAARHLGMHAVRFRGALDLQRTLAAAGLPVEQPILQPIPGIRAIVWDWGGVFYPLNFFRRSRRWEERLALPIGTVNDLLCGNEWKRFEIGAISAEEYNAHLQCGLRLPNYEAVLRFHVEYFAEDRLERRVVDALRALRRRYRVALLSNNANGHVSSSRARFSFDPRAEFDVYVNSAEVGLAKPDPAIYQLTLDRLGLTAGEVLFVDDMLRNTDAAALLGIHTVLFGDIDGGLADLAAVLGHPLVAPG